MAIDLVTPNISGGLGGFDRSSFSGLGSSRPQLNSQEIQFLDYLDLRLERDEVVPWTASEYRDYTVHAFKILSGAGSSQFDINLSLFTCVQELLWQTLESLRENSPAKFRVCAQRWQNLDRVFDYIEKSFNDKSALISIGSGIRRSCFWDASPHSRGHFPNALNQLIRRVKESPACRNPD